MFIKPTVFPTSWHRQSRWPSVVNIKITTTVLKKQDESSQNGHVSLIHRAIKTTAFVLGMVANTPSSLLFWALASCEIWMLRTLEGIWYSPPTLGALRRVPKQVIQGANSTEWRRKLKVILSISFTTEWVLVFLGCALLMLSPLVHGFFK